MAPYEKYLGDLTSAEKQWEGNISHLTPSLSGVFGLKFSVMYFWVN